MGIDKQRMDKEVKDIHSRIKKSNLILKAKFKEIQDELTEWDFNGDSNAEDKGNRV